MNVTATPVCVELQYVVEIIYIRCPLIFYGDKMKYVVCHQQKFEDSLVTE